MQVQYQIFHYQTKLIKFLEFIELNVNLDKMIKNVKQIDLNISIATIFFNTQILKTI